MDGGLSGPELVYETVIIGIAITDPSAENARTVELKLVKGQGTKQITSRHKPHRRIFVVRVVDCQPYRRRTGGRSRNVRACASSKSSYLENGGSMSPVFVLIADDNELPAELLLTALRGKGYEAEAVENGDIALRSARAHRPKLSVLDARKPDLDGFGALAAFKSDPNLRHIPALMLTSLRAPGVQKARELGADDHIVKPFDTRLLQGRLRQVHERAAASSQSNTSTWVLL